MQQLVPDYRGAEKYMLERLASDLASTLYYHSVHHTIAVINAAVLIVENENLSESDMILLRTAIVFHDSGYLVTYANHEEEGCIFARQILPNYGFSSQQIDTICSLILATKISYSPQTKLEQIICDADLDYLGREDVDAIANKLYEELKALSVITNQNQWVERQIRFLKEHHYYTVFSKQNRERKKQEYLKRLEAVGNI